MKKRVPPELSTLIQSLRTEQRAKVEALFETALTAARQRGIGHLWEQPELSSSYWILLTSGLDEEAEVEIAEVLLKWKGFFVRDSASVLCFQSSERESFRCCSNAFKVTGYPTLVLGNSPEMVEHARFERQLLLSLIAQKGAFHRFLNSLQMVLERTGSLSEIRDQVSEGRFWTDLKLVPSEAKPFVWTFVHEPNQFDVFLSHNSVDKGGILRLAKALRGRGLKVWLDDWELVPGRPWQDALEAIIGTVRTAVVVIGQDGLGPWEVPEMRGCISQFVERHMPVSPVLLPGAKRAPDLPLFLRQFTWVDLRKGFARGAIDRLERGIRGTLPTKDDPPTGCAASDGITRHSRRRPRAGRA